MESRFLTLQEASTYLNVPLHYLYRLSSEGRLPGRIAWGPRQIRIDRYRLEEWMEQQMENGGGENGAH